MICQECNQRQASLHFTKIINGEKTEFHICEQCAKEKGEQFPGTNSFSIHQLLSGLLHFEQPMKAEQDAAKALKELVCDKCEMTYEQFTRVGRFGCAHCYKSFESKLDPILKRVHSGNHTHAGKLPERIGGGIQLQRQIDTLKQQLKAYVEEEEFEKAAELRDQIRLLDQQKNEKKEG
ncbi:UvrB/UvrC motif-containing protein [Halalkalibacter nanhaiisediminis]|uniref:Protein arginine kinase activator n=1 Tax=Halalkalibacter nanhaiisediminis TaxID=688079 RepID=A0A562QA46_9BACI|nr:UvrB/UvrC motif-containing protein [Halalkalibacter nanhaiisediminis]TWI53593.1 protein arginine kinase activator [Halalkalibacter nanhaiisediminis]